MEQIFATLALTFGASFCAGINLYATVFTLGAMSRFTSFDLPTGLEALESHWVIWPALLMYAVEFVADKVPAVDSAWDAIHTFIRIPAGVVLAAGALGEMPMEAQIVAGMIGGTLAAAAHGAKATTRLAAHATGTSPIVTPVASVVEDVVVFGTTAFIVANPVLALIALVVMGAGVWFVLRTFWRIARGIFSGLGTLVHGEAPQRRPVVHAFTDTRAAGRIALR